MDQTVFSLSDTKSFDKRYRATLINTLSGFKSANLVGTTDKNGSFNLAIFNSVVHLGANPPLLGMVLRPTSVPRHTYDNLSEVGYYTLNHIHQGIFEQAHQTSAKYGRESSEFEACGLTPELGDRHPAPYVRESFIKIGMEYVEEYLIEANKTRLIVGKIIELVLPEASIEPDGYLDLSAFDTVSISGLDAYYLPQPLGRRAYARPDEVPQALVPPSLAYSQGTPVNHLPQLNKLGTPPRRRRSMRRVACIEK